MSLEFPLSPGRWFGWLQIPELATGFGASPIRIDEITPLKTGKGLLRLNFTQPLHPGGGTERQIVLKVVQRAPTHLTGVFDVSGERHTAVISHLSFEWMDTCCANLFHRRPPQQPTWLINGEPLPHISVEQYIEQLFGRSDQELLTGTSRASFDVEISSMPKQLVQLSLGQEYDPLDSWLIARGRTPHQMEDKWFIYLEEGRLLFRRSWTGFLVYDVEATWRDEHLYLGAVIGNRDSEQYAETDDAYDIKLLRYLIDALLRGLRAEFPCKGDAETGALEAWSVAGRASLT